MPLRSQISFPPMIDSLLPLLRCPRSRQPLTLGTRGELDKLNADIAGGEIYNAGGRVVTEPADAILVVADRSCAYLVRDGIPILLPEEAVPAPGV
jgi:uncharacterized protein YbaR (Trm112 family)